MKTLYDLLGALPHDDAETLRTAFRKAVKGAHPDIRPGDPDAALKFREIVRANEILGDPEQRAVYDDLLELACLEQASASREIIAASRHRLASGLIALVGAAAMSIAGFLFFMHMSAASVASASNIDVKPASAAHETTGPSAVAALDGLGRDFAEGKASAAAIGEIPDSGQRDLNGRLAALDQPNPAYLPAYMDNRVILYRNKESGHAFGDRPRAKLSEAPSRSKSAPKAPRLEQSAVARWARRLSRQQMAAYDPSRGEGFASAMTR